MDLSGCLLIIRYRSMSSGMHWKNEIASAFSRFLTSPTLSSCQDPSPPLYYFLFPTFEGLVKVSYMLKLPFFHLLHHHLPAMPFPSTALCSIRWAYMHVICSLKHHFTQESFLDVWISLPICMFNYLCLTGLQSLILRSFGSEGYFMGLMNSNLFSW